MGFDCWISERVVNRVSLQRHMPSCGLDKLCGLDKRRLVQFSTGMSEEHSPKKQPAAKSVPKLVGDRKSYRNLRLDLLYAKVLKCPV